MSDWIKIFLSILSDTVHLKRIVFVNYALLSVCVKGRESTGVADCTAFVSLSVHNAGREFR
jgi:hypothetical protein